ncbi:MAG: glycosyltransferase family 2 protein [Alphaproteobacteria bacterium]|nr:glycosyltransferase family 2 protein [Alphaproteobacteria bacterium]
MSQASAPPKLSALVVAHNEEDQLADCLSSLSFADEVVVVLDRCTDSSRDIALAHGARIEEGAWEIEGERRNRGIAMCEGDWILEVDADERVSDALSGEIREVIGHAGYGHFLIPYHNYVGDRLVEFGWGAAWGVSATVRLFANDPDRGPAKQWGDQRIHPSVELRGESGRLTQPMIHRVDRNISDMIARLDRYTSARARDLRASGDIGSFGRNVRRIFTRFWKCYVSRRGYREGQYGFLIALMAGIYPILSYLKANLEDD